MQHATTAGPVDTHHFPSAAEQATALAQAVGHQLAAALQARGQASLAVSGGRSPLAFFAALREQALDWTRVTVTLVDERCVPAEHPDRNARLVRLHLLQGAAAQATLVDWLPGVPDPALLAPNDLVALARAQLRRVPWPLDVAVLGMGEDGHTASWFPDSPGLAEALHGTAALCWVRPAHAPHLRLTLTLSALSTCRHLHLAIAGARKQQVLADALAGRTPSPPIQSLLGQTATLQAWIAD